jgi:hypothetical protein
VKFLFFSRLNPKRLVEACKKVTNCVLLRLHFRLDKLTIKNLAISFAAIKSAARDQMSIDIIAWHFDVYTF